MTIPVDGRAVGAVLAGLPAGVVGVVVGVVVTVTPDGVAGALLAGVAGVGSVVVANGVAAEASTDPSALGAGDSLKGGGAAIEPVQAEIASMATVPRRPTAAAVRPVIALRRTETALSIT